MTNLPLGPTLLLNLLPDELHSRALVMSLNMLGRKNDMSSRLHVFENLRVCLTILDTNTHLRLRITKGQIFNDLSKTKPDVHIKSSANNYLRLLRQEVDPDTLFFSRELIIEGSTEESVRLKNTITAIDFNLENYINHLPGKSLLTRLVHKISH